MAITLLPRQLMSHLCRVTIQPPSHTSVRSPTSFSGGHALSPDDLGALDAGLFYERPFAACNISAVSPEAIAEPLD